MEFLVTTGLVGGATTILSILLWLKALSMHAEKEELRREIRKLLSNEETAHLYETLAQLHEIEDDDRHSYTAGGRGNIRANKAETLGIIAGVMYFGGSFILLFPYFLGTWVVAGPGHALGIFFFPLALLFLASWVSGLRKRLS